MNIIRRFYHFVKDILPTSKSIVFESMPDFSDNTQAVYKEMLNQGLNRKYKFVWLCNSNDSCKEKEKNELILTPKNKILRWYYTRFSKCLISCNNTLSTSKKGQVSFYLTHGSPIKSVRHYYNIPHNVDYIITASEEMNRHCCYELNFDIKRSIPLGYPRNDVLCKNNKRTSAYFGNEADRVIIWYPTVRQNKRGRKTASKHALPLIHDPDIAKELNDYAKKHNTIIVLKPHFAQDISYIKDLDLTNIIFIDDSFFKKHNITSYEFISSCDAMITDYSSVYYDYTLCNKPIAVIWEDIDEYRIEPGFAIDLDDYLKGAEKIYSLNDFKQFILDLEMKNDKLYEQRNEIKDRVNFSSDGKSSLRVVNFIKDKAKL